MINALLAASTGATSSADKISIPPIRYLPILPPIIMIGGAVVLLAVASLVKRDLRVRVSTIGSVIIAGGAFGISIWQWSDVQSHGAHTYIAHAVVMDGFSVLVTMLLSAAMLLSALVADGYLRREGIAGAEFHVLALLSVSGAMLMGSANDLIIVFLGLEILSIALYVLTAFNHHMATSGEAALKYFILGGFSSAIFIYGIALTYGATGSTNLTQIADYLSKNVVLTNGLLLAGLALMLVGFAFKVAAVPFHMWTPDVYEGAPTPVTGFMAAVAKVGAFAALLRVLFSSLGVISADWRPIIYGLAVLSLFVGRRRRPPPARRQAHAGVLVDQPRRVHPARRVCSDPPGRERFALLLDGLHVHDDRYLRHRDGAGPHRGRGSRPHPLPGPGATPAAVGPVVGHPPPGPGRRAVHHRPVGQVAGRPGHGVRRCGAAGGDRHGDRGHRRLLLSAGGGPDVRVDPVRASPATPSPILCRPRSASGASALPSAGPDVAAATVTTLNTELLLADDPPAPTGEETPTVVPIPALTSVAIGICVAFTVVFGVMPGAAAGLRQPRHAPLPGPLARRLRHRARRQGRVHHAHRGHERR